MKPLLLAVLSATLLSFSSPDGFAAPADAQSVDRNSGSVEGNSQSVEGNVSSIRSVPGGVYLHALPEGVLRVRYKDKPVLLFRHVAIVGIALSARPGTHELVLEHADGTTERRTFEVSEKRYTEQRLTIENPRMVNPNPEDMKRIQSESAKMRTQYLRFTETLENPLPFLQPVAGPLSSSFGRRRVLNGQPRNPHSGLDIVANTGTPILAPAPGKVTLTGEFFFNGNAVFVDHGQGLITMVCHLSRIDVAEGATVSRGQQLGLVGATGRVTGAHLHWSVSMNGNRVDPVQVMDLFSNKSTDP
ncbi:MAG: M23 family metallopeptidase [Pseudomonadales bacterium]